MRISPALQAALATALTAIVLATVALLAPEDDQPPKLGTGALVELARRQMLDDRDAYLTENCARWEYYQQAVRPDGSNWCAEFHRAP